MKKTLSLLFCAGLFTNLFPAQAVVSEFHDMEGHWAQLHADYLHAECGVDGYKDAQGQLLYEFRPNNTITRAELAQMIVNCIKPEYRDIEAEDFSDVRSDDWFSYAVTFGSVSGWVEGYSDGTFRPHQNVNRAEALKMLLASRFESSKIDGGNEDFSDVRAGDWFQPYVSFAVMKEYVAGYSDGSFRPGQNITRAEAAKILSLVHEEVTYGTPAPESEPEPKKEEPPLVSTSGPTLEGCPIFPADNPWNTDISDYPLHPNSDDYIASMLEGRETLHPDWGGNGEYGIPFVTVGADQPKVPVEAYYADESDLPPEGYPIPPDAPVEGGSDKHVLVIDTDNCMLYETWDSTYEGPGWSVGSAAIFDLTSNELRPDGWTSADAAGLPVFPGLVRYDEAEAGAINHALRFTASQTQKAYIHPATHYASDSTNPDHPPMGLRLRLKADFDTSGYTGHARVILESLKKYGMILADNGSDWYITGAADPRWDDEDVGQLKNVPGSAFEVVYTGDLIY